MGECLFNPLERFSLIKSTVSTHAQDPAIASIGSAPSRRNGGGGGFGEGFGYGGGIGGKGLSRGGRQNGYVARASTCANNSPRRNDHENHGSTTGHGSLHGPTHHTSGSTKDISGGPMGKFAMKSTADKMKLGGDENRRPKDDWRRGTYSRMQGSDLIRCTTPTDSTS
jgi:hypothetical protein